MFSLHISDSIAKYRPFPVKESAAKPASPTHVVAGLQPASILLRVCDPANTMSKNLLQINPFKIVAD